MLKSRKLIGIEQGRQLYQPRWRISTEHVDQVLAAWFPTQPSKSLQHRHVGFARAVVFNTLPPPNPHFLLCDKLSEEGFHYCRSANPGLTRHQKRFVACRPGF